MDPNKDMSLNSYLEIKCILQIFGLRLTTKLQRRLFSKILAQPTEFFDGASVCVR